MTQHLLSAEQIEGIKGLLNRGNEVYDTKPFYLQDYQISDGLFGTLPGFDLTTATQITDIFWTTYIDDAVNLSAAVNEILGQPRALTISSDLLDLQNAVGIQLTEIEYNVVKLEIANALAYEYGVAYDYLSTVDGDTSNAADLGSGLIKSTI